MKNILGIDASFLSYGGGITHLTEILNNYDPLINNFDQIIIWSQPEILVKFPEKKFIIKRPQRILKRGYFASIIWKIFFLPILAKKEKANLVLNLSGWPCFFKPYVTINHNLLPFSNSEIKRFFGRKSFIRFVLLRYLYTFSFRNANGLIFLSKYAKEKVENITGKLNCKTAIIPHGINSRFRKKPSIKDRRFNLKDKTINIIYVSFIEIYKHQWHVVDAIHKLRLEGFEIKLHLVGKAFKFASRKLDAKLKILDPSKSWVLLYGQVNYEAINILYEKSDIGIIASSCETFCIPLIEKMASGMPIACSINKPMSDLLGDSGYYFDPEKPNQIYLAIKSIIKNKSQSFNSAYQNYEKSKNYSWDKCSKNTFNFLEKISNN